MRAAGELTKAIGVAIELAGPFERGPAGIGREEIQEMIQVCGVPPDLEADVTLLVNSLVRLSQDVRAAERTKKRITKVLGETDLPEI